MVNPCTTAVTGWALSGMPATSEADSTAACSDPCIAISRHWGEKTTTGHQHINLTASSTWLDPPAAYPLTWGSLLVASPSMVWDDIPSTGPPRDLLPGHQGIAAVREDQGTAEPHPFDFREDGEMGTISNAEYTGVASSMAIDSPSSSAVGKRVRRLRKTVTDLKCPKPGCTFEGTFSRPYELRRHIAQKHSDKGKFFGTAIGCFKGNGRTIFSRADKLTDHIRQAHMRAVITEETAKNETLFNCPVEDCAFPPMALDLLGVHLKGHGRVDNRWYKENIPQHQAIYNAADTKRTKCPLWKCGNHSRIEHLQDHLLKHRPSELLAEEETINHQGYILVRAPSTLFDNHSYDTEAGRGLQSTPIAEVHIKCPVPRCITTAPTHSAFLAHMSVSHAAASDVSHIDAYFHSVKEYDILYSCTDEEVTVSWDLFHKISFWKQKGTCPTCGFTGYLSDGHERSLLADFTELYPVRRQILKLCPEFVSHPVFDDLKPAQPTRVNGASR